jgi:multicomponent Na+:H+ antiporter subunit D
MSLAAYGLVNHRGDSASTYAGRVYIVLAITGEVLLFAALIGLVHGAGQIQFPLRFAAPPPDWAIACAVLGFGVKAGMLPLHLSVPLSYGAAPLAGGVALAGAMLNAGLLGWLRWLPLGSVELSTWGFFFTGAGLLGAAWGVVQGVRQGSPRALLGYSSVSQVGLMMLFIGAGFLAPGQWTLFLPLLGYFVLHHACAKTALFCASSGHLPAVGPRWLWWAVFSLPALALIGVPLSSGYLAKAGLVEVVASPGVGLAALAPWLTLATAGTAVLMTRWIYLVIQARQCNAPLAPAPWVALALALLVAAGPLLAVFFGLSVPVVGAGLSAAG